MGGGGHGHGDPYKIPDYKIYKVEDVPRLMQIKRALAAQGLSDPWLRNEVWRYNTKEFSTHHDMLKKLMFRGFKLGLAATVVTVLGTAIYDKIFPDEHHHHGDH
ncbi:unnamed protein product [Phyllotreta striolata]|uniref:NADH dehydrogenase [ubiquinone] 1 beta subcomplex subunit 3 n=1 Tax=Phyllotreta striolata TaxID=444603 RepID=A0A9N9XN35_PHYSR|nr:unnamed protein product [Phyllotreta striolata]